MNFKLSLGTSLDFLPRFRILSGPITAKNRSANLETDSLFESTVKRITEVTSQKGHGKDIIIDIVNVNDIVKVIANDIGVHTGHFENVRQR